MSVSGIFNTKINFSKNAHSGSFAPPHSTPLTPNKTSRTLRYSENNAIKQESTFKNELIAPEMGRRSVLLMAPLLFLPVTGCSSGGFYDTGKKQQINSS
jgi:hypothetical protein